MVFRKMLSCVTYYRNTLQVFKKKFENEDADFIYLNDDQKK